MSAQASGVLGVGTEPPPDSSDPSRQVVMSDGSAVTAPRSAWVICPTFSSRVIWASSSRALASGRSELSIHGRSGAAAPAPAAEGAATSPITTSTQTPTTPRRMGRSTRHMTAPLARARLMGTRGETAQ